MERLRFFLAAMVLATGIGSLSSPTPASGATWNGIIMAGRPLRDKTNTVGGATSNCMVAAYGRVDGNLVVFLPHHCRDAAKGDVPYGPAYTNGHVQIGWWGNPNSLWENNDLTYITLDVNSVWYPSSGRNRVYRGDVNYNYKVDSEDYWFLTTQPGVNDGCAGFPAGGEYPDKSFRMWQPTMAADTRYEAGNVTGLTKLYDACTVFTDFDAWNEGVPSGTPVIRYSDKTTLNGIIGMYNAWTNQVDEGTKSNYGYYGYPAVAFRPLYETLEILDTYWDGHGLKKGAFLCINSACTE